MLQGSESVLLSVFAQSLQCGRRKGMSHPTHCMSFFGNMYLPLHESPPFFSGPAFIICQANSEGPLRHIHSCLLASEHRHWKYHEGGVLSCIARRSTPAVDAT
jgi:hypothetical protein